MPASMPGRNKKKPGDFFYRIPVACLSGVLLSFAFPPRHYWPIAFFALVPAFLTSYPRPRAEFFRGWLAGLVFYAITLFWLTKVAGVIYLLLAVYLSFFWGLFFFLVKILPASGLIPLTACTWFFLEIIASSLFTGFPWLVLGLSQYSNRFLLPLSAYVTVYGLSSIVVFFNLLFSFGWRRHYLYSWLATVPLLFFIVAAAHYGGKQTKINGWLKILLIQENISSAQRFSPEEIFQAHYQTTKNLLLKEKVDLVIWPESSYPDLLNMRVDLVRKLKELTSRYSCSLLLGSLSQIGEDMFNTAYLFIGEKVQIYQKTHLVPYGEFLPGAKNPVIRKIFYHFAGYIPRLQYGKEFSVFNLPVEGKNVRISVLICFENIFPEISRKFALQGSQAFFVLTNDSWFGQSQGPYQHFAHNLLRSAETGRYFIQSALTGITGIVSPCSGITSTLEKEGKKIFVRGYLRGTVPLVTGQTFALRYGVLPLALVLLFITGVILCRI